MKTVAIFGATSAIAEQVARLYAAQGARLFLAARNEGALERIVDDLRVRGAEAVQAHVIDLDDIETFGSMLDACEAALGPIDIALIAFGALGDHEECKRVAASARKLLSTNFVSPACLAGEIAERMARRGSGVIGAITSVAGDRGRQSNYVYGAAKGGLSIFLAGLRHRFAATNIKIVDIKPGFVDTPMTAAMEKGGPLWASPQRVAQDIRGALDRGRSMVYTPWFWGHIMRIVRMLPEPIFHKTKL